jgi:hypothetical protein
MGQTYAEFKTYLETFLWKLGDAKLIEALDSLIKMGISELDRKLTINRRENTVTWPAVMDGSHVQALPADFKQILSLNSDRFLHERVSSGQIALERTANKTNTERQYVFITNGQLVFGHTFILGNPVLTNYTLTYRTKLPDHITEISGDGGLSWVEDEYLDLYTYTILKHSAPWLREDQRVQLWAGLAKDALDSVLEEDAFAIEYGTSPTKMNMPRSPSPIRGRGGLYSRK